MRIKVFGAACLFAGSLLAVGRPSDGWAQGTSGRIGTFSGAIEIGARTKPLSDSLQWGKFLEYKDMPSGAVLEQLVLRYTPIDSFGTYELTGRNLLQRDGSARFRAKRPGLYDFQVSWDGLLHTFSTTARSPGSELNTGFNTLPNPRPDSTRWLNAPYLGAVHTVWNTIRSSLAVSPTTDADFKADYTFINKRGGRPSGLSFAGSGGPTREYVQPIDESMNDIRVSHNYANKDFQFSASYAYSQFLNDRKSTRVDSPLNGSDTPTNGSASSLVSFAPNNTAHLITATGAANVAEKTRVTATATYSLMRQNDAFFPQALNSWLSSDPRLALPRRSLDGQAKTYSVAVGATSRLTDELTLTAKLRTYDYSNSTPAFHIGAMAVSDRSIAVADSQDFEPKPFTKNNADISATYRFPHALSVTAGYAYESWKRDSALRNFAKTTENTPRVSVDYSGVDWLSLHGSYSSGSRRGDSYTSAGTEIADFRRYDLGNRDQARAVLIATVTPIDPVSVSLTYQSLDNKYPNLYGTQKDNSNAVGADVSWTPTTELTLGAGFSTEDLDNILASRYRTGAAGSATYNNPAYNWFSEDKGKAVTTYLSATAVLIPDKLDGGVSYSMYDSRFHLLNWNPLTPTGGTATQNLAATAENWPDVTSKLQPMTLFLRYRYAADWAVTLRYQMEKYDQNDFRFLAPQLWPGYSYPVGDLPTAIGAYHFLGDNYRSYNASWITFLISYRPSAMPFGVGRPAF